MYGCHPLFICKRNAFVRLVGLAVRQRMARQACGSRALAWAGRSCAARSGEVAYAPLGTFIESHTRQATLCLFTPGVRLNNMPNEPSASGQLIRRTDRYKRQGAVSVQTPLRLCHFCWITVSRLDVRSCIATRDGKQLDHCNPCKEVGAFYYELIFTYQNAWSNQDYQLRQEPYFP